MRKTLTFIRLRFFMSLFLIVFFAKHEINAATYFGTGGNWSQTSSWWSTPTGGAVSTIPTALDAVVILENRVQNVDILTAECKSLQIGRSTNDNSQLTVTQNQKLKVWGDVLLSSPSGAPHRYSSLEVDNGGILEITGNVTLQASTTNNTTYLGRHTPTNTMTILIGGSVAVGTSGVFDISGSGNSIATIRGAFDIDKNGTLNLSGSGNNTVTVSGTMTNTGDINIVNTGSGSSRLSVTGIVTNNGSMLLSSASIFSYGDTYKGSGEFVGKLFTNPVGRTMASSPPGCPRFKDGFDNYGTLAIDLNGTTSCTLAGQLQVTGAATINPGSILSVNFGYTPIIGQTFLLTTGATSGSFSTIKVNPSGITGRYSLGILTVDAVLSAELTEFTADTEGGKTKLNWHTASEENTSHFVIERSANGLSFEKIGETSAWGKSSDYNFIDEAPLKGINYYRLTIVDLDGTFSYSKIISILHKGESGKLKVYPNPVGTEGYLNLETTDAVQNIIITNALGQTVLTAQTTRINIAQLAKGLYCVRVKTGKETLTEKFFKN